MFEQYQYIEDAHKFALASTLRKASVLSLTGVTVALLARLYQYAVDGLSSTTIQRPVEGAFISRILSTTHVIATVTDAKTGVYIQLARETAGSPTKAYLTVGAKWTMEQRDSLGATNTLTW